MLVRSLPATCCTASKRQSCNQSVRLDLSAWSAGQLSKPGCTACHPFQLFNSRLLQKQRVRVANPRHDSDQEASRQSTNSWDEPPPTDVGQDGSHQASGVDWARLQSLAALTGASTLAAVVLLQLSGKTDIPKFAYNNVPESVQDALPEQLGGKQHKPPWQLFDIGAFLQTAKVSIYVPFNLRQQHWSPSPHAYASRSLGCIVFSWQHEQHGMRVVAISCALGAVMLPYFFGIM